MPKTHKAAVVLIPPKRVWEPIQRIRRVHDRQVRRWMPHITLLYPFRPESEFAACVPRLAAACARAEPFDMRLATFGCFEHRTSFTMWLDPAPNEPLARLHTELVRKFPDCDDTARFDGGFRPHLSVGQARGREELDSILAGISAGWEPLEFTAGEVAMIRRGPETGEVFRVERTIALGGAR